MEQHRAQASSSVSKARASLSLLVERCAAPIADGYVVRADQLRRIVSAAVKLSACSYFRYRILLSLDAASHEAFPLLPSSACIVVCSPFEANAFELGSVVQVMQLQAAEIGLSALPIKDFDARLLADALSLPLLPCAVLAVGRAAAPVSCEPSLLDDFFI